MTDKQLALFLQQYLFTFDEIYTNMKNAKGEAELNKHVYDFGDELKRLEAEILLLKGSPKKVDLMSSEEIDGELLKKLDDIHTALVHMPEESQKAFKKALFEHAEREGNRKILGF